MAKFDSLEDLWMGQEYALGATFGFVGIEPKDRSLREGRAFARNVADPKLRALQVAQNSDRAAEFGLRHAHRCVDLFDEVVRRMAHVDAEHVYAGLEEALDHLGGVRRRSKRGDDLDAPRASHLL